jgi:hypothetical protein
MTNSWGTTYDTLIGNSIIPDLVMGTLLWFGRLAAELPVIVTSAILGTGEGGGIVGAITAGAAVVLDAWSKLIDPIKTAWTTFWNSIPGTVTGAILGTSGEGGVRSGGVVGAIQGTFETLYQLGQKMVEQVGNGISDNVSDIINAMVDAIKAAIRQAEGALKGWNPMGGGGGAPPGKAAGGSVYAGHQYMVGERGPELFTPKLSGTIIPNSALVGMNNSTSTSNRTYNLNYVNNGGSEVTEAGIQRMFERMEMMAALNPAT